MMSDTRIILYLDEEDLSDEVYVEDRGSGFYRLLEHPIFSERVKYGDIVELKKMADDRYSLVRVAKPSSLVKAEFILTALAEKKPSLINILQKLMDANGYWQRDFGGLLFVFYHPEVYNPVDDILAVVGENL